MRFLLISHIFPPAIDGGSSHLYSIGDCLKKQGHQIYCLSTNCRSTDDFVNPKSSSLRETKRRSNPHKIATASGLAMTKFKLPVYKNLRLPLKLINLILSKGPIFKAFPLLQTLLTIRQFQPDYIIAGPFPTTISFYARFIQKITYTKLILVPCFHSTDALFSHPSLIKCLHQADCIFTLTNFEKKYLSKHFHLHSQKFKIVPSGVPQPLLKKTPATFPPKPNILYLGSFSTHKGIKTLIKSIPFDCTLTLAGQKTLYWPQIEKHIKSLPLPTQKNIKTIFNFPSSRLPQIIDLCTCLILPSNQESFGKVLLESWARKKPVIVKNTPAPVELVNGSHGGLIFKNNLKKQILKLINNPPLRRQLGQNGYNFVKKSYTWDKIGKDLCQKLSL